MPCLSAPCYGTKMPQKSVFFSGIEYYYLQRDIEKDQGSIKSRQYFFDISYGIYDWLSLDLKVGPGDIKKYNSESGNCDYGLRFDGGYGVRVKIFEKQRFKSVCGFQHISVHPQNVKQDNKSYKAVLDDWQFSVLASYSFIAITPYAGTRVSRSDYISWIDNQRKRHMSDLSKSVGFIAGCDIAITEKMWLNVEGSMLDSRALAFSLKSKF